MVGSLHGLMDKFHAKIGYTQRLVVGSEYCANNDQFVLI
jgi:hypothetical protein